MWCHHIYIICTCNVFVCMYHIDYFTTSTDYAKFRSSFHLSNLAIFSAIERVAIAGSIDHRESPFCSI